MKPLSGKRMASALYDDNIKDGDRELFTKTNCPLRSNFFGIAKDTQ